VLLSKRVIFLNISVTKTDCTETVISFQKLSATIMNDKRLGLESQSVKEKTLKDTLFGNTTIHVGFAEGKEGYPCFRTSIRG
jgi:hypothetical protein